VTGPTARPAVVVAVPLSPPLLDRLAGCDVTTLPTGRFGEEAFRTVLADAEGALVGSHVTVDRQAIDSAPKLRVISTMSVGVDHIDLDAARERNITVTITPVLSDAVADVTMALITMLARHLPEGMRAVTSGRWRGVPLGSDLAGKLLVVVGFGRIGRAVAARALAAKMRVEYVDARPETTPLDGTERADDLAEALGRADVVSLHVDLNDETRGLLGRDQLRSMKPTALVVNTSRGAVVDQSALTWALRQGEIAGAGLDVLEQEPPDPDDPLLKAPNVLILPHIGSATTETRFAMAECAVDNLLQVLGDEACPNVVRGA
jgi:lactate dehydrogenase-like 2-hydroxyacid dehydrogenase